MTDKILTDDEKEALLDGMTSGEVEVQSNDGPIYAEVKPFVVGPRSRILTNTYPRLRDLNKQLAGRISKKAEQLLNVETDISARSIESCPFSELCERIQGLSLAIEFAVSPLNGPGLIYLESGVIGHLVEAFFGGSCKDAIPQGSDFFSPGEISVTNLFVDTLLKSIQYIWQPVIEFAPVRLATRHGTDIIDDIELTDPVICCEFEIDIAEHQEVFHIVWPVSTVASLVPVFEGQKRERDSAEDNRWEKALRARAAGMVVAISSCVGQVRLSLAEVAALRPGDIINIDSPRKATLFAQQVPVMEGHYGVHEGRNAIEATRWLLPDCVALRTSRKVTS